MKRLFVLRASIEVAFVRIYQILSIDRAPLHSTDQSEAIDLNMALPQSL